MRLCRSKDNVITGYSVGDKVEIDLASALNLPSEYKINVTIKGIVKSPLTFGKDGEPSYNNPEDTEIPDNMAEINKLDLLENILYCPTGICALPSKGDLYIKAENRNLFDLFLRLRKIRRKRKNRIDGTFRRRRAYHYALR